MHYNKPATSFSKQITILQNRGLIINDKSLAESYLSSIGFYRLRAYTYPFQDNNDINHPFTSQVTFEQIVDLYVFDRKLRLLVLDAIERIEIAFRTQIIYQWAMTHGSHWHTNANLFRNPHSFKQNSSKLQREINRSRETFLKHYNAKYTNPIIPPVWMSLEVSSFGLLSKMFLDLKRGKEKKEVASYFGLRSEEVLATWMRSFSDIRNICAHHSRLWNRRLSAHIKIPKKTSHKFIKNKNIAPYKIYVSICAMAYIMDIINPTSTFKKRLIQLIDSCPLNQQGSMGFPNNWKTELFWQA